MAFTHIFKQHISHEAVAIVFEFSIRSDLWENRRRVQTVPKKDSGESGIMNQNYPVFFDYHNYCNNVPPLNHAEYLSSGNVTFSTLNGNPPSFCEVCDQHFRTPVIYNRHMRSRKHALKCIRTKMDQRRNRPDESLSLLPNEVIDTLIRDLNENVDEKNSFFEDINLDKCSENSEPSQLLPSFKNVFIHDGTGTGVEAINPQQHLSLNSVVPKIYPCSLCFRTLHSQELFDQHLQEKHFRDSEPIYF